MTSRRDIRDDLEPGAPEDLIRLAERLEHERPVPTAAFRGDLRRSLLARGAAYSRPARLRLLVAGYAGAGSALLLVGAASAAGLGPLAS
ncbi:MAG: hypothetical protein QOE11_2601 [Solirubrobacteraceae bacterium]|jgi:hypothetical protein|nr:hypothetical protein [Solirubrobacteraceae bacterium]